MGNTVDNLMAHCADTPASRKVTPDDIIMWHLCANTKDGKTFRFMGRNYNADTIKDQRLCLPSSKIIPANLINGRGWRVPGYSDMIDTFGVLHNLVPYNFDAVIDPWEITNGAAGHNSNTRHIMLAGGKTPISIMKTPDKDGLYQIEELYSEKMIETFISYINMQKEVYPEINLIGHNEVSKKLCPGFDVQKFALKYL